MARFLFCLNWMNTPTAAQYFALAERLAVSGHTSVILGSNRSAGPSDYRVPKEAGVSVISWPDVRAKSLRDGMFLRRLIGHLEPDCITGQFRTVNLAIPLGWMARVPVRVAWARTLFGRRSLHGDSRMRFYYLTTRKRMVYRLATHVAIVSEAQLPEMKRWFGVPSTKCVVVPNSLSPPGGQSLPSTIARIVSIGRLEPTKGHAVLLEAFARLKRRMSGPRELVLVGDGALKDELVKHAEKLGIRDAVTFTGKLPHERAMDQLRAATVCAQPSLSEAFGYSVLESMACGVPVVASAVGGIPEVVGEEGECALLVQPGDPVGLADALERVLSDRALGIRLGEEGRRRFLEKFHIDGWADRVAAWLEGEVASRR